MGVHRSGAARAKMEHFKRNSFLICTYCGQQLTYNQATVDHRVPLSRGGQSEKSNFAIACKKCNQEKDNMTPEEFAEFQKAYKSKALYYQDLAIEEARHDSRYIDIDDFFKGEHKKWKIK
jgi:5-methylcytosine-specific restriction endonuclease McrA